MQKLVHWACIYTHTVNELTFNLYNNICKLFNFELTFMHTGTKFVITKYYYYRKYQPMNFMEHLIVIHVYVILDTLVMPWHITSVQNVLTVMDRINSSKLTVHRTQIQNVVTVWKGKVVTSSVFQLTPDYDLNQYMCIHTV